LIREYANRNPVGPVVLHDIKTYCFEEVEAQGFCAGDCPSYSMLSSNAISAAMGRCCSRDSATVGGAPAHTVVISSLIRRTSLLPLGS